MCAEGSVSSNPVSLVTLFRSASQLDKSRVDRDSVDGENEVRGSRGAERDRCEYKWWPK